MAQVPDKYITLIEEGVLSAMELGIVEGFPVVDVKVTVFDGSYHDLDSNEMAFRFASSIAFKDAAKRARPVVLEPIMAVKIEMPSELSAAIQHEVRRYRGRVERATVASGFAEIDAMLPLSELLPMTSSGLAAFPMEFAGYEAVRSKGSSDEDGSGAMVNKPNDPGPRNRSAMARRPPSAQS